MPSDREKRMHAAIQAAKNGTSVRAAARKHSIPRTTLQRHINGGQTIHEAHEKQQSLSPRQEAHLVRWVKLQTKLGFSSPHSRLMMYALRISRASGGPKTFGRHWIRCFLQRNPELNTLRSVRYDWKRANAACSTNIVKFFQRLDDPLMSAIPLAHTYNADEIGSQIGIGDAPLVIGPSKL